MSMNVPDKSMSVYFAFISCLSTISLITNHLISEIYKHMHNVVIGDVYAKSLGE